MNNPILLKLLDKHILECDRAPTTSWHKKGTRASCIVITGMFLSFYFVVSYMLYLFGLESVPILLGLVPKDFTAFGLFNITEHSNIALYCHIGAFVCALINPIHRIVYNLYIFNVKGGMVTTCEDPWPPMNLGKDSRTEVLLT